MSAVRIEIENGIGTVVMDRPDRHNAFDEHVIAELTAGFAGLGADECGARGGAARRRQKLLGRRRSRLDAPHGGL